MTFLDALYSLFIYITINLPTFDISTKDLVIGSVMTVWSMGFIYSCVLELTTPEPKPLLPVTWEKVARARINGAGDLWFAVAECIDNHHGEEAGAPWREFVKIRIDRSSNGDFRAVSHGMTISLPDWQWSE